MGSSVPIIIRTLNNSLWHFFLWNSSSGFITLSQSLYWWSNNFKRLYLFCCCKILTYDWFSCFFSNFVSIKAINRLSSNYSRKYWHDVICFWKRVVSIKKLRQLFNIFHVSSHRWFSGIEMLFRSWITNRSSPSQSILQQEQSLVKWILLKRSLKIHGRAWVRLEFS